MDCIDHVTPQQSSEHLAAAARTSKRCRMFRANAHKDGNARFPGVKPDRALVCGRVSLLGCDILKPKSKRRTRITGVEAMNALDILQIEHACTKLAIRYANCLDTFDDDGVIGLFAPDGVWNHTSQGAMRGHDVIRAYLATRDQNTLVRHVMSNFEVDVISPTQAKGRSYWTAFLATDYVPGKISPVDAPFSIGEYADEYVCIDGRWHFATRTMNHLFGKLPSWWKAK